MATGSLTFEMPEIVTLGEDNLSIELTDLSLFSEAFEFSYYGELVGYPGNSFRTGFDFTLDLKNPCNKGNRVMFRDNSKNSGATVVSWVADPLMVKWTTTVIDLNEVFVDSYSLNNEGSCGDLVFEIDDL